MAGPSIAVRILGDLTGFGKSVDDTAAKGTGAASKLHSAFTGALGALNTTGVLGPFSAALDGIDTAIGNIAEHGKGIGQAMLGAGTAIAVNDNEILDAGRELASLEGIFAAPEGAACVIAARKLLANRFLKPSDRIVLYSTGSGLKYLDAYSV